jgi:uncharacterized protein (DUF433 family)
MYYEIEQTTSGNILGVYEGDTIEEAIQAMLDDVGCAGESDLALTVREVHVTARITAMGVDSTVPDNPGAVDAMIYVCGRKLGEVTLLPPEDPRSARACPVGEGLDHWASGPVSDWLVRHPNRDVAMAAIEDAVGYAQRITVDPKVMGGVPCIRDLRIPVATVVAMAADGMSQPEILSDFPDLEAADITAALGYADTEESS